MAKWVITADHICGKVTDDFSLPSRVGYGNFKGDPNELPHEFKLYDDDNELYYEGRCSSDESFQPLDWAEGDAGCTYIKYKNPKTGTWEIL
jgi:hypothetical protein